MYFVIVSIRQQLHVYVLVPLMFSLETLQSCNYRHVRALIFSIRWEMMRRICYEFRICKAHSDSNISLLECAPLSVRT